MQNNIIKQDLFDNTIDSYVVINPTKQQVAFYPKEESQMFTSKESTFTGNRPASFQNDPETESENTDTRAFIQRAKDDTAGIPIDYSDFYGGLPGGATSQGNGYKYNLHNINSSHTETDYIGAANVEIPAIINETFATFNLYNLTTNTTSILYTVDDTAAKIRSIINGMQSVRIPKGIFNTTLTDETAIIANNNSPLVKNYGFYYVAIAPLYVRTTVANIIQRNHYDWYNLYVNGELAYDGGNSLLKITPITQRRTVYECTKADFQNLPWNFETSGLQSGRLYGSVVEVWDSGETVLKQTKVMMENEFNFSNVDANAHFALSPDNVGYDSPAQKVSTGDVLRIYPRETYFNQMIIEVNYQNSFTQIQNLLAFMMNDAVRDITTGVYQIYDDNGFQIDTSGNINGTVLSAFQLFNTGKYEARKVIKNTGGN